MYFKLKKQFRGVLMVFLYSCAKIVGRLLQKSEVLSFHRLLFWGGGAINLILLKSIPYEERHFASSLYSFIIRGEHKVSSSCVSFIGFVHFHLLCRTLSGEGSLPFTAQVQICVKTSVFIPLGSLGFQQRKRLALCRHVTVSSLT